MATRTRPDVAALSWRGPDVETWNRPPSSCPSRVAGHDRKVPGKPPRVTFLPKTSLPSPLGPGGRAAWACVPGGQAAAGAANARVQGLPPPCEAAPGETAAQRTCHICELWVFLANQRGNCQHPRVPGGWRQLEKGENATKTNGSLARQQTKRQDAAASRPFFLALLRLRARYPDGRMWDIGRAGQSHGCVARARKGCVRSAEKMQRSRRAVRHTVPTVPLTIVENFRNQVVKWMCLGSPRLPCPAWGAGQGHR